MTPNDRKYTRTHEWIKTDGNLAVVGITDHAQKLLGDITFVEVPAAGEMVEQAEECGVIESVKAASDIYSPVAGKVAEANGKLENEPEIINRDPYGKGWMFKLKEFDADQVDGLLDADEYEALLEE